MRSGRQFRGYASGALSGRTIQILCVGLAAAIAVSAFTLRKHFIRTFFHRSAELRRPLELPAANSPSLPRAEKVRVLLIDGLGRKQAKRLDHLNAACARGLDLEIDVGFPTVSLPVQTVLWSGLTQQQAGVQFVATRLDPPPSLALPSQVPDSIAVAELHPYLVHSFGFAESAPEGDKLKGEAKTEWLRQFEERAADAVRSERALAFVHIGRVDVAGHAYGAASRQYQLAARESDAIAGKLFELASEPGFRWFVLSDHGHLPKGGHGGAEEHIRMVRACVFGDGIAPQSGRAQLVDLSHALFASLAIDQPPDSGGRPLLAVAQGRVEVGSSLPAGPKGARLLVALVLLALGLVVTIAAARLSPLLWPWWLLLSYGCIVAIRGLPTLSNPMVYPPVGRSIYVAAVPGLLLLAASVARARGSTARVLVSQLALTISLAAAALVSCGGVTALLGGVPPLVPGYTAHASVLLVLTFAGGAAALLAVLVRAALAAFYPNSGAKIRRRDA